MTTKIEWVKNGDGTQGKTWNPVTGCTKVSPGCEHCYAERMSKRLAGRCGYPADNPFKVTLHPRRLTEPLHWRKPRTIFVCSMGDLFHDDVPDEFIDQVFAVMALCPQHTFQVLTKRPERMQEYISGAERQEDVCTEIACRAWGWDACRAAENLGGKWIPPQYEEDGYGRVEAAGYVDEVDIPWPLPNVWLGVTAENQEQADKRIPLLLETPAAVKFVSIEPMLGAVDLTTKETCPDCGGSGYWWTPGRGPAYVNSYGDPPRHKTTCETCGGNFDYPGDGEIATFPDGIHWVICGGETGPGARPIHPDWVRFLRDQCQYAGVPFFFKSWGDWKPISEMSESEYEALYHPTPETDPLAIRKCKVATMGFQFDGEEGYRLIENSPGYLCFKVGKKHAGALLDGREWRESPNV
jgi:protein gp37